MKKIKVLNEQLWMQRASRPMIDNWLSNFADDLESDGPSEQLHALFLLSQFIFFADREVRELLRALYRDHYYYPIIEEVRRNNGDTTDRAFLESALANEILHTRFVGIGNPAESGTHLLYYFRQENRLPKSRFSSVTELFDRPIGDSEVRLADAGVRRIVLIDDFCGSGSQAVEYSDQLVAVLRRISRETGKQLHISYLVVAARTEGLDLVRAKADFDVVSTVLELDEGHRSLTAGSRHFADASEGIDQEFARGMALRYGSTLTSAHPLGWQQGELLLGFQHNIPDNTLPIIWWNEPGTAWRPIFPRHSKIYG